MRMRGGEVPITALVYYAQIGGWDRVVSKALKG